MTHHSHILAALVLAAALPAQAFASEASPPSSPRSISLPSTGAALSEPKDDGPPLLFGKQLDVGAYGGLDVAYSRMFGQDGALVGLQGALLLDHRLSLGLAGYGWTNSQTAPPDALGNAQRFETGYGGATLRYSLYVEDLPVYLSVGALIGGGAIALVNEKDDNEFDRDEEEDVFAVVQPDLTLHANLTSWLRMGITAGYRFTSGVDRNGYRESDIDGWLVGGQVQFGRF